MAWWLVAAAAARLKVEKGKTLKKCVNGKQGRGEADSNAQHGTDSSREEPPARARTHTHTDARARAHISRTFNTLIWTSRKAQGSLLICVWQVQTDFLRVGVCVVNIIFNYAQQCCANIKSALLKSVFDAMRARTIFSTSLIGHQSAFIYFSFLLFAFLTGFMQRNCSCFVPARFHFSSDSIRISFKLKTLLVPAGWDVWETQTSFSCRASCQLYGTPREDWQSLQNSITPSHWWVAACQWHSMQHAQVFVGVATCDCRLSPLCVDQWLRAAAHSCGHGRAPRAFIKTWYTPAARGVTVTSLLEINTCSPETEECSTVF